MNKKTNAPNLFLNTQESFMKRHNKSTKAHSELYIERSNYCAYLTKDNIFKIVFSKDCILEKIDFELALKDYHDVSKDGNLKVIMVFQKKTSVSLDALLFAHQTEVSVIAKAYVLTSLNQRLMFKYYQKFKSLSYPVKEFKTEDQAISWLNEF